MSESSSSTGVDVITGAGLSGGAVAWGVVCFVLTLVFTTWLVWRYQRPNTPYAISAITWLAWLCSFVIVFLVPLDINNVNSTSLSPVWSAVFWTGFICTWLLLPMIQEYYDNGGFTAWQKFKLACRQNLILVCVALVVVLAIVLYLVIAKGQSGDAVIVTFKTLSNAIGLILLILLGGYGLVEFPRMLYHSSHRSRRRDFIYYKAADTSHEAADARDEFCELLKLITSVDRKVQAQHDAALKENMEEIKAAVREKDEELQARNYKPIKTKLDIVEVFDKKNRIDVNDLIKLNYAVRKNVRHLWLCDKLWSDTVNEAFQLEAELADAAGELANAGDLESGAGNSLSKLHVSAAHLSWYRRVAHPKILLGLSVICALTSILILWSELSIVISAYGNTDMSPFTYMVTDLKDAFLIQQILTVSLIGYFTLCSAYPLFKLRISSMYYLGRRHTDTNSLIYNATIMLRASIALAFNFTKLLSLDPGGLGDLLGSLQEVPFLGGSLNDIFPIFMLVWALMIAFNAIGRIATLCNIERFQFIAASVSAGSKDLSDAQMEARGQISEGRQLVKAEKTKRDAALAAGERFEFHAGQREPSTSPSLSGVARSAPRSSISMTPTSEIPSSRTAYRARMEEKAKGAVRQSASANSLNSSLMGDSAANAGSGGSYAGRNRAASPPPESGGGASGVSRHGKFRNKGAEDTQPFLR